MHWFSTNIFTTSWLFLGLLGFSLSENSGSNLFPPSSLKSNNLLSSLTRVVLRNDLRVLFSVMVLLSFILNCKFSYASVLTDTSQEMCYSYMGDMYDLDEIPCNAAVSCYGQDGHYTQAPKPSYANNLDGTVTDLNSGLMWQQNPDCVRRSWQTAKDYCENLVLANHDDWELPSRHQLVSILDFGRWHPALNTDYFNHCPSGPEQYWEFYWTGTTITGKPQEAYTVEFYHGGPLGSLSAENSKLAGSRVRCVRGSSLPVSHFVDNQDGTVTDTTTGLMWQKGHQPTLTQWRGNLDYCEDLELAGHTDWRLPNIRELETLIDDTRYNPSIDPLFDSYSNEYASSTTIAIDPERDILPAEFSVAFVNGSIIDSSKRNILGARCVRLGPPSDFWNKQEIDPNLGGFSALHFIDSTTGWVVGSEEKVLKTADGGNTWTILHDGGSLSYSAVHFTDPSNGWVISNFYSLYGRGYIFHTDDGGLTWNEQLPESTGYYRDIFFLNANTGWVIGGSTIRKTEDGGATWVEQQATGGIYDIFFLDSNTGWIVGDVIIKTEDAGTTWVEQPYGDTLHLRSAFFTDTKNGWTTGLNGMILHTSDGGTTWEAQDSGTCMPLYSVGFSDSRTGFIFGIYGIFLHTIDGGETWTRHYSGTPNSVSPVQFVDGTGYALAEGRAILKIRPDIIDWTDTDRDGDVDGKDLANFIAGFADDPNTEKLKTFALTYGN